MARALLQTLGALAMPLTPIWVLIIKGQTAFLEFSSLFYSYSIAVFLATLSLDITFAREYIKQSTCVTVFSITSLVSIGIVQLYMKKEGDVLNFFILYISVYATCVMSYLQNCALVSGRTDDIDRMAWLRIGICFITYFSVHFFADAETVFLFFALILFLATLLELYVGILKSESYKHYIRPLPDLRFLFRNVFVFFNFSFAGLVNALERSTVATLPNGSFVSLYLMYSSIFGTLT